MMGTHEDPLEIAAAPPAVLPLVYACSGCSAAAQLANGLAVHLDRAGLAEMSCVAGIGGDVPSLLKKARSGRPIVVLDGCPLHCARNCLARHAIPVGVHIDLSESGVRKRMHEDPSPKETRRVWSGVVLPSLAALQEDDAGRGNMIQGGRAAHRGMDKIA